MRKTLIALILVLPIVFILVIFSTANLVSLGVNISVNGIKIHAEDLTEDGTLFIDMADVAPRTVTAEVTPGNATDKGYAFSTSDNSVVEVTDDGEILPKGEGTAEIIATSNDKSFTDSLPVVIVSSKPYDFSFAIEDDDGNNLLTTSGSGYTGKVPAGRRNYKMNILPVGFTEYTVTAQSGSYVEAEKGSRRLFLPFSGDAAFTVTVQNGVHGDIVKTVNLDVTKPAGAVLINGESEFSGLRLAYGVKKIRLYVECSGGSPQFESEHARLAGDPTRLGTDRYILDINIDEVEDGFPATIIAGGKTVNFLFNFTDFDFSVFSDMPIDTASDGSQSVTMFTGKPAAFYAVCALGSAEATYEWQFSGPSSYISAVGDTATISAAKGGEYTLAVSAKLGERTVEKKIKLTVIDRINAIQIANNFKVDLAECYTVAGKAYNDRLELTKNLFPLKVYTYSADGQNLAGEEVEYSVSDESIASIDIADGVPVLSPKGRGKVTVTAAWKGNGAFGTSVRAAVTLNIVNDAVAAGNAPELVKATADGEIVVLTADIALGTNGQGKVLPVAELKSMLGKMKSTYNTEWYKNTSDTPAPDDSIYYVMEFKNDVFGNGKSIDAGNFTLAIDDAGTVPLPLYRGPLYFVKYKEVASVAGQDNCAFLVRTDGVKLYGVNLLGCSDNVLYNEGKYNLSNLNYVGTTLEVNASAEIVNCRIRNGRNVVRAYGGNRSGDSYFIDTLAENRGCDSERAKVRIEGCILSQGREFILKIGANRALRASTANGVEPDLKDGNGVPYAVQGKSNNYGELYKDQYFYTSYVMTDVVLKDSVLETSGLFTVGIESNFSGEFLYEGAGKHQWSQYTGEWEKSGGTSFASVLRLEGDVRLYDWKDLSLIDSSTLIESPIGGQLSKWMKLDIKEMLKFVSGRNPEVYGGIIDTSDGNEYVHGGIALYGGGKNYSSVDMSALNTTLSDFSHYNVNISVLAEAGGTMEQQGTILPRAAGKQDFNFYMYGKDSVNNYQKQLADATSGQKYKGVTRLPAF